VILHNTASKRGDVTW